ncbi:MAG: BTAD domain-containing putative transcriptional regulator [Anaerolineales bacterium]|nr:MAG: BTAD domain-containing putative transcriptional regulator [Anaerolineales bacterium]
MNPPLEIVVLGKPQIKWQGQPLTADLISAKGQALLFYLAVTGQACSRQSISGLLWGDFSEERARGNLRLTLSKLRGVVGDYIIPTRQSLAFDFSLPYSLDAGEFTRHCAAPEKSKPSQLESVIARYRGNFLDDFHLHEAPDFETWVVVERERFQQMALASLAHLAATTQQQGDFERAAAFTRRILALEPWREEAHRQLMTVLAQSGQRTAALSQFDACKKHLDEELGVEPSAETKALYEKIKRGDVKEADGDSARRVESKSPSKSSPRKSASDLRHNLPQNLTSFLGREAELAQIGGLLGKPECRILTLVGPGGVGKTRLSIRAARMQVERFQDGVRFLSLRGMKPADPIETTELLIAAIADAVGYTFSAQRSPRELLLKHLADKETLFVLDNFEPLLAARLGIREHTESLLLDILKECPAVKLLATSRERINLPSEWLVEVQGLPYPPTFEKNAMMQYPSVELFVQQARRVNANFSLDDQEYAVNRICQLVAGFPLGIELSANWVRLLSCEEIVERLERGGEILTTDLPESNPSLRSVLDSTWAMLTEQEQAVFRRLSVFREGFTLSAAQQAADASLPVLNSLMNKSMVRRDGNGRYVLHELLKQFGSYHLNLAPEQERETRQKHGRFYGSFLQSRRAALQDLSDKSVLNVLDTEIENIRAALEWYFEQADVEAITSYLESLIRFNKRKGWFQESVFILEKACASENIPALQLGYWHRWLGEAYYNLGNITASTHHLETALFHLGYPMPKHPLRLSFASFSQAVVQIWRRVWRPRPRAMEHEEVEKRLAVVAACERLILIYWFQSKLDAIFYLVFFPLNLVESVGNVPALAQINANAAIGLSLSPISNTAKYYLQNGLQLAQRLNDPSMLGQVLEYAGLYHIGRGEWEQAETALQKASELLGEAEFYRQWEEATGLISEMKYLHGDFSGAIQLQQKIIASARQRGDTQFQFHESTGLAMNNLRLGDIEKTNEHLHNAAALLGENNGVTDKIRYYGLSAQAVLKQGNLLAAKEFAEQAMALISKVKPTAFYILEGYAGVSEVYLTALENGKQPEDLKSARRAVKALHEFGQLLRVGRPRAWLHQGLLDWAEGRQKKAFGAWEKSLGLAEQLSLPYEAARAHYEIGRHAEVNSPARQIHLEKAIEIFSQLGARHDLEKARTVQDP